MLPIRAAAAYLQAPLRALRNLDNMFVAEFPSPAYFAVITLSVAIAPLQQQRQVASRV